MRIVIAALLAGVLATQAHADDLKVYKPQVTKGEFALEANLNYSADHRADADNYFSQVLGFEYGFTDYWKAEFSGELEKETGSGNKLTNIKWENVIVPFKQGEKWIDVGLYVELEKGARHNDPNNVEGKLLLEKTVGKIDTTANFVLSREFGYNHSTSIGTGMALQSEYRISKTFNPGFEYYAKIDDARHVGKADDQTHLFGPVVDGKIGKVSYNTGVLFGVSSAAPDTTVKLNLEYEF